MKDFIKNIKYAIIDSDIFFTKKDILFISDEDNLNEKIDSIFISNQEKDCPTHAIAFSAYDGFAIKNILQEVLNLKISLICSENFSKYIEIIKRRTTALNVEYIQIKVEEKKEFISRFCENNACEPENIIYFGNDTTLLQDIGFACSISSLHEKKEMQNFKSKRFDNFPTPHAIRKFANQYICNEIELEKHYFQNNTIDETCCNEFANDSRALICDIDGTCTDGYMIFAEDGSNWKRFSKLDISAIKRLRELNFPVFFITGEPGITPIKFAKICDIPEDHVFRNAGYKKLEIFKEICKKYKFSAKNITYIGDDLNDIELMKFLIKNNGTIACPQNSMPKILSINGIIRLKSSGGFGAIHELIESHIKQFL